MKPFSTSSIQSLSRITFANAGLLLSLVVTTPAGAQTYSDLYNFGGATGDPTNPQSSRIIAQGRDGELYSTTPFGGSNGQGAAFKISPTGALRIRKPQS